jgi:tellurite resistance protein TehA-like permease
MSAETAAMPASPALWRAFLVHAAVAGAFGVLTIFWGQPSVHVMSVAGGLYFLGLAIAVHLTERSLKTQDAVPAWLTRTVPVFLAVSGALNLWIHSDSVFGGTGALALILLGVVYLVVWAKNRGRHAAARDFLLTGVISLLTGALLPMFEALGAHALLGVAGGGAVITAVVLALAALSYRHDSREVAGATGRIKRVN